MLIGLAHYPVVLASLRTTAFRLINGELKVHIGGVEYPPKKRRAEAPRFLVVFGASLLPKPNCRVSFMAFHQGHALCQRS